MARLRNRKKKTYHVCIHDPCGEHKYFSISVLSKDGIVSDAPPFAKWMRGRSLVEIVNLIN